MDSIPIASEFSEPFALSLAGRIVAYLGNTLAGPEIIIAPPRASLVSRCSQLHRLSLEDSWHNHIVVIRIIEALRANRGEQGRITSGRTLGALNSLDSENDSYQPPTSNARVFCDPNRSLGNHASG